ncbi:hypothetical protein STEG23_019191, partial [Scotinomys teguina]
FYQILWCFGLLDVQNINHTLLVSETSGSNLPVLIPRVFAGCKVSSLERICVCFYLTRMLALTSHNTYYNLSSATLFDIQQVLVWEE